MSTSLTTETGPAAVIDPSSPQGYRRDPGLQQRFEAAARTLLEADGWVDPERGGERGLVADLALEGGGVKGIGLVGAVLALSEAGYTFARVAGTSAGSIAATLVAAIGRAGRPMTALRDYMGSMDFSAFMPEGKLHAFLDHHGGKVGSITADAAILSQRMGLYPGDYLEHWLGPILRDELGVRTFDDLRLTQADDPGMSLPPGHQYRVVVHTSDITRAELVRLPWDYPLYGYQPDDRDVVEAVRASMSIPFFFEPVTLEALAAEVSLPTPGGGSVTRHYDGGTVTWVDGGMLRNFPINAFDRVDGLPPRWPTIGVKLSSLQTRFPATTACSSALAVGVHCLRTMMNEWDAYSVDEATAGRTIFVDNGGLTATDFELTSDQQDQLFLNGVTAATEFVLAMADARGVPRTADAARRLVRSRQAG
ncbi:MAG TPA: patatin-like phospholipase family protein [Acidimicrobiales bacterium]|jgi:NTE family protein|nr:patatin-like phospholipase family protein [Acidimicrobiales bacterium]